eukprot:TRINITY_DN4058_c0_g1_i1.p1 TRINITY_DN4058_c0_g1~~TRINITY_DN4058_c0_g1_i1.p1  ORF type:complete len:365 (-),score=32.49 TRINITY_DN4058_c0_g1_i1:42-1136(-)
MKKNAFQLYKILSKTDSSSAELILDDLDKEWELIGKIENYIAVLNAICYLSHINKLTYKGELTILKIFNTILHDISDVSEDTLLDAIDALGQLLSYDKVSAYLRTGELQRYLGMAIKKLRRLTEKSKDKFTHYWFKWLLERQYCSDSFAYYGDNIKSMKEFYIGCKSPEVKIGQNLRTVRTDYYGKPRSVCFPFYLSHGKWRFEVLIMSAVDIAIGWQSFSDNLSNAHTNQWAITFHFEYEGDKIVVKLLQNGVKYDESYIWQPEGLKVTCAIDFCNREIFYSVNNSVLTRAYHNFYLLRNVFAPFALLSYQSQCKFNWGEKGYDKSVLLQEYRPLHLASFSLKRRILMHAKNSYSANQPRRNF